MDYRNLFQEDNTAVMERLQLSMERIEGILTEETVAEPYRDYFIQAAQFISMMGELFEKNSREETESADLAALKQLNHRLYEDILPGRYENSYANPAFAAAQLGEELGRLLSFLYTQIRGDIVFAYESRLTEITILNETLIEIYNMFEEGTPKAADIRDIIYWFTFDYCDLTVEYRIREGLDPELSFAEDIIMNRDLSDLRYLYCFGEYISDTELEVAGFLNKLPEETIDRMAETYVEGYRKGFEVMGRDLSKKKNVMIRYPLGFERMIKKAVLCFRKLGLTPVFCRTAQWSINRRPSGNPGYRGTSPNRQYEYDHRYDSAIYLDKALKERKLAVLKAAYEKYKKEAGIYAGPAVVETFGEDGFEPVNKPEACRLTEKQEKLLLSLNNESSRILNEYIPGEETSFTIIAFPVPAIGADFEAVFHETIRINTLDYELYKNIQQVIIDTLDQAGTVEITGREGNETRLTVALHPICDPARQTNFENCVADVNIPLGEVFTSPMLAGTNGLLHIKQVYLQDYQFKNLKLTFCDGMVTDYSCDNFDSPEEGRDLVKQMVLKNHDTLPMGEFAIGTNTSAYAMARRFGILEKLPILIVEKMGPHFAVGDTCYSWSEDAAVYNPDGKEIIARDNEISQQRKTDLSKAYFNCHMDITIPYAELDRIVAVKKDGTKVAIIEDGYFTLSGTEELNKPLT